MGKFQYIEISKDLLKFSEEGNMKQIEKIAREFTKEELEFFSDHPAFENFDGFNAKLPKNEKHFDAIIIEDITKHTDQKIKDIIKKQNLSANIKMKEKTSAASYDEIKKELSIKELIKIYGEDFELSNLPKGTRIRNKCKAEEFQKQNKEPLKDTEIIII